MLRTDPSSGPSVSSVIAKLTNIGNDAPSPEEKSQLFLELLTRAPDSGPAVFAHLHRNILRLSQGLAAARGNVEELRQKLEELLGKTWFPGLFLEFIGPSSNRSALVCQGQTRRVVGVCDTVPLDSLTRGCEVLLNRELSAIVGCSDRPCRSTGHIAVVVEKTDRRTVIVRSHEEEIEADLAQQLEDIALKAGDRVRWDQQACLVFDRIEQTEQSRFQLGEVPDVPLSAVGGQEQNVRKLLGVLSAVLIDPHLAGQYGVSGRQSVLLVGKPGSGKTLMVRAVVSEISRLTGKVVRFYSIKPAELESCLVGNTEKNVRELFDTVRRVTRREGSLAIIFFDEIDAIGRTRGQMQGHYSDKSLTALLAELDGFSGRDGIGIVATTNRKDLLDNALLQRLTDHEIHVCPPDLHGAKAIFAIHLGESLPFHHNGSPASATRNQIIETAVARLYSPNSPYAELCRLKFRDGKTRIVSARDFICGRIIQQIASAAKLLAYQRELQGGERGLAVCDIEEAIAAAVDRLTTNVTICNVRNQLGDLPTDVDVVSVEPIPRKVDRPHRFIVETHSAA